MSKINTTLHFEAMNLHPHQITGVKYLLAREPNSYSKSKIYGSILADDMGLGKTIQTIALIDKSPLQRTLLFCPSTLCGMWQAQLKKFAPHINVFRFFEKNSLSQNMLQEKQVIICSYGISFRRPELQDFKYDRIVCDEAHIFRNQKSKTFTGIMKLQATAKLVLTGTPIQNKIGDIATLVKFITGYQKKLGIDFLKLFVKDRMLMRKIEDVGITLPSIDINHVELNDRHSNGKIVKLTNNFPFSHHLEALIRRKQASIFPHTLTKRFRETYDLEPFSVSNAKANHVVEQVLQSDDNCIIFTEYRDELKYIVSQLQELKPSLNVASISGDVSLEEREKITKDLSINVLVIQINTAGVGLNLQHFSTVHFTNIPWNPSVTDQAIGRIKRIGQQNEMKVFIYSLKESIDNRISEVVTCKRNAIHKFFSEV